MGKIRIKDLLCVPLGLLDQAASRDRCASFCRKTLAYLSFARECLLLLTRLLLIRITREIVTTAGTLISLNELELSP